MIKKLQIKFIAVMMLFFTTIMIFTFSAIYTSILNELEEVSITAMKETISSENISYYPGGTIITDGTSDENDIGTSIMTFYVTIDSHGLITSFHGDNVTISDEETFMEILNLCYQSNETDGIIPDGSLRFLKQQTPAGTIIAFADRTWEKATLSSISFAFIFISTGCLCAFFIISYFLSIWVLRPVKSALERQMRFLADASHELKTPLTVILANTDIVTSHPDETVESQSKWLSYIRDESVRMTELVNNMMFLAKNDSAEQKLIKNEVSLSDVVWNSVLPFESVAFEKGKTLVSDIAPDMVVIGDEKKLRQLIVILIDNALKYANDYGTISVNLTSVQGKIKLYVRNTTDTAIPQDKIKHLFDRFYRVDSSRARQEGGYGLGLAIAKMIAYEHGATIKVSSSVEKGTMFTVTFPKKK